MFNPDLEKVLSFLDDHYEAFWSVQKIASETKHPVPMDTRGWSQILASLLSGHSGLGRQKGADLADGSDVKGANTWEAIDTPRFNGVIKAGTKSEYSNNISSLDNMPDLYLVLWDISPRNTYRCRVWIVNCQDDPLFREMAETWYFKKANEEIKSDNFQLHPPRNLDSNIIRNTCGNLSYPLLFCAERTSESNYQTISYDPTTLRHGRCVKV